MGFNVTYLFSIDNVHYHTPLQHLCQTCLHCKIGRSGIAVRGLAVAIGRGFVVEHIWRGTKSSGAGVLQLEMKQQFKIGEKKNIVR